MPPTYRGVLVPADPAQPITEWTFATPLVAGDSDPEVRLRQALAQSINAEWLECVAPTHLHNLAPSKTHTVTMVVDEEGAMSHINKPINPRAWLLYPSTVSVVYGDMVLMGQRRDPEQGYILESLPAHITAKVLAQKIMEIIGSVPLL